MPEQLPDRLPRYALCRDQYQRDNLSKIFPELSERNELQASAQQKPAVSSGFLSGRGWDRTSDPSRVKRVLSR
jgi:hypothetical protein